MKHVIIYQYHQINQMVIIMDKFNDCLIEYIISNNINDTEQWKWELLHFDASFSTPTNIKFDNISHGDLFISFIIRYCYYNTNPPSMDEMKNAMNEIKCNDDEEDILLKKADEQTKENQDEIDIEKQELIKQEFKLKRMMKELEIKKRD